MIISRFNFQTPVAPVYALGLDGEGKRSSAPALLRLSDFAIITNKATTHGCFEVHIITRIDQLPRFKKFRLKTGSESDVAGIDHKSRIGDL